MTVDILVIREDKDNPEYIVYGDTIVDALLSNKTFAIHRGRQEMEANAQQYMTVDLDVIYRDGINVGDPIRVSEYINSPYLYSKVTDISYRIDSGSVSMKVNTRRPLDQVSLDERW